MNTIIGKSWIRSMVLVFAVGLFTQASLATPRCSEVLAEKLAPKSIHYYLDLVARRQNTELTPRFLDPEVEAALVPFWKGSREAPKAVKETLLETTALIDFSLMAADKGVVKMAEPGEFASFRLNETWRGKDLSTNLGMPIDAITARSLEGSSYLVPSNAKGVFIFMHGGGTKTTGHHVAANIANFFNQFGVVVIAIDAPFHGYGPRNKDLTPIEYYEYLRDFRHKYIPPNVSTFIGGHSMGGLHADNIMRLSDNPKYKLQDAFAGLINLSGPMDAAPGRSLAEKNRIEDEFNRNEELMEKVPEAERDLNVSLLLAGKASPLGGFSASTFMSLVNWSVPTHNGRDYLPTLAVMGARDGLMVGREAIFQKYVADLANVTPHVLGQRKDFKGEDIWVSHMIFDHYRPGTKQFETFHLIKEFMEQTLGQKLELEPLRDAEGKIKTDKDGRELTITHPLVAHRDSATIGTFSRVMQSYYNNLAFRIFAKRYSILVKEATSEAQKLGEKMGGIQREVKSLDRELKALRKDKENNKEELEVKEALMDSLQKEARELRELLSSNFVPGEGHPLAHLRDVAKPNVARRLDIRAKINANVQAKKALVKELRQLRDRQMRVEKEHARNLEKELALEAVDNPQLAAARQKAQEVLTELVRLQEQMNKMTEDQVVKNLEDGVFATNPTPAMIAVHKQLDAVYGRYVEANNVVRQRIEEAIAERALGNEAQELLKELWGSVSAYRKGQPTPDSLLGKINDISGKIEKIEIENSALTKESNALELQYVVKVTPHLYDARLTTLEAELNRPIEEVLSNISHINKIWGDWTDIWKERPPEQATSLY